LSVADNERLRALVRILARAAAVQEYNRTSVNIDRFDEH
jgi:hypothetical protein